MQEAAREAATWPCILKPHLEAAPAASEATLQLLGHWPRECARGFLGVFLEPFWGREAR